MEGEMRRNVITIIWENEEAWKAYAETPLKQEIDENVRELHMTVMREGYPLMHASIPKKIA